MKSMLEEQQPTAIDATAGAGRTMSCWSCKGPVREGALFCSTCQAVQPPGQVDHFRRLGIAETFDVDVDALEQEYFSLQRQLHPDRFATRTARERALSQQQATALNEAYETLKDPLRRADYLIHLRGTDVLPEGCNLVNDQELLMEAMELREALAEADTPDEVRALAHRAGDDIKECVDEMTKAFEVDDFESACRLSTRLKYLTKLAEETRARRAQIAAT
jgi:molecular chaperone HscB